MVNTINFDEMAKSEDQKLEEVLKRISESFVTVAPTIYHPSECVNQKMDPPALDGNIPKNEKTIFHVINGYHIYCKMCQHHIYSHSKLNDINSFFQAHINSVDHVWNRGSCNWDENKPILQWEKWLYTGFCAICNKSGIEAFVIDAMPDMVNIIRQHVRRSCHQEKYKSFKRAGFDEIMAKLDLFSKIYIVKISKGRYLCRVCGFEIQREALIENHLNSKQHCQKFHQLFKKEFNINLDNRHLKLDTEELAWQMRELPAFKSDSAVTNKKKFNHVKETYCTWDSEMKFLSQLQLGFSPSAMDKAYSVVDEDLRLASFCALCQEHPASMNRHLSSNSHQLRVMVFQQCSLVRPVSLVEYLPTSVSSPVHLKKYKKYKLFLQKQGLDFGIPYKPEYAHINLNSENFDEESNYKAIYDKIRTIEAGDLTTEKASRKNPQVNMLKSVETKESAVPTPEEVKQPPDNVILNGDTGENTTGKEKPEDITTEKMNLKDFSTVWLCIDKYLEKVTASDGSKHPKLHEKRNKDKRCSCYIEDKSTLILALRKDPNFIYTFEKWNFLDTSYYVCVLCGSSYKYTEDIFPHLKKRIHIHRYRELKNGNLKPFSPSKYSINMKEKAYICKLCGKRVCDIESTDFSIPLAARRISVHETNCSASRKCPSVVPVSENDAESLTAELKRILMIGSESGGSESSRTADFPCLNQDNLVRENVKKSEQIVVKPVENCVKKMEERTIEDAKPIKRKRSPEDTENKVEDPKKEFRHKTNKGKCRERNSTKSLPKKKESVLKQNLNNFLKHCGSGLTGFLCAICLENDSMGALDGHLKSETHMANETFICIRWFVQLGFCKFCKLLLLGTSDMFRQHYTSVYHIDREGDTSKKENSSKSATPETIDILVVKGVPNMPKEDEERCIRLLLTPFGSIKRVYVRKNCSEVLFFDPRVVANVLAVGKFMLDKKKSINFFLKTVTRDVEIAMNSSEIFLLGHGKTKLFVSCLVKEADNMMMSTEEKEKEEELCDSLQKVLQCVYPNCKCFKFGSRVTGLIVGDCDLDVFLDYGNVYYAEGSESPENQSRIVKKVAAALKASKHFGQVTGIEHCRVPIVTCLHKNTNIHCDISFKNGLSCENTNLIKFMISIDDRVKGVILFLKYWTKCNGLHGRPYFSSYALTMFVFFYLQQEPDPVLPTVEFLKSCYSEPEKVIGEWDCGFTTDKELIPKTKNCDSVVHLILGFFNFCNTFNFSENVISPLTGKPLLKERIRNMAKGGLPAPYDKYQSKISPGNYASREAICVMDPFDLNHNLTKVFPQLSFERFLYLCRLSSNLLSNSLKSKYFDHLYDNFKD